MEIKVEKRQFRWNLLLFMFFTCTILIHPIIFCLDDVIFQPLIDAVKSIAEENSGLNTYAEIVVPTVFVILLAATPVCICVLLQKNWPLKVKLKAILIIIIYFEVVRFMLQPFSRLYVFIVLFMLLGPIAPLILFIPIILGVLIYYLILNKYHKEYDKIEYKVISMQENTLLWTTYICLGIATICVCLIEISYIPTERDILNPLYIVISLYISLPIQIVVLLQRSWTLFAKFINIILTDIVFLCIGLIVNVLLNIDMFGLVVTPFAPLAGCVLLKHIFIKSSLDALERKE